MRSMPIIGLVFLSLLSHAQKGILDYSLDHNQLVIYSIKECLLSEIEYDLRVVRDGQPASNGMIGESAVAKNRIAFTPRFGLIPGASYQVWIKGCGTLLQEVVLIDGEDEPKSETSVIQVYPTANKIPANQLKLYVEFSSPIMGGNVYEGIRLYRLPDYKEEVDAFIRMGEELWDTDRTRLTLFFDPGRIKQGVSPNEQLGLPLVSGVKYRLIIDSSIQDINGLPLAKIFIKDFEVGPVDRQKPDWENWSIDFPNTGARQGLTILFPESMDYALLNRLIVVLNENNHPVKGTIEISDYESKWVFQPGENWQVGQYHLIVNPLLEDLAGNSLSRLFDVDLTDEEQKPKSNSDLKLSFYPMGGPVGIMLHQSKFIDHD